MPHPLLELTVKKTREEFFLNNGELVRMNTNVVKYEERIYEVDETSALYSRSRMWKF